MNIGLYASKIQAEVLAERGALEKAYRDYPDANLYWCMVDLAKNSNFRLAMGPEQGYIRGESFFAMVKAATRPYTEIRIFKEVGDSVLMCSGGGGCRPFLEAGILMLQATKQLAYVAGDQTYPFAIRMAIDYGIAKQLSRRYEDYLGEPIDRLARIMTVRSERSNFLIGEPAFSNDRKVFDEYRSICEIAGPLQLQLSGGKQLTEQIIYRELVLKAETLPEFSDYFTAWKQGTLRHS